MTLAPHRRKNPLTGRWVLVSPRRSTRPWSGETSPPTRKALPRHDPECHLCRGSTRANGLTNPNYESVFVFDNDFPALDAQGTAAPTQASPSTNDLLIAAPVTGRCRVMCYSPDHDRPMSRLEIKEIRQVVDCWVDEAQELGTTHRSVQIFENKGEMMGCSNPHPHGQIWATVHVPDELLLEDVHQRDWLSSHGMPMLLDVAQREIDGIRQVTANEHWLVIVPWWAAWPFETLLLPRFPIQRITQLDDSQRESLAQILSDLTRRYDRLFGCDFPYSMGWHGAPFGEDHLEHWQLHAHFYPPLLRSATIKKFMVGYEMLAEPQRDLTPEQAAMRLRELNVPSSR
jgi:UDPglucose--hexose-1-phosphate uridylyltransferase